MLSLGFCSHRRSWVYFAESVRSVKSESFSSRWCHSWESFVNNDCDDTCSYQQNSTRACAQVFMGIDADSSTKGNYFLQTNSRSPFSRGLKGTVYNVLNE